MARVDDEAVGPCVDEQLARLAPDSAWDPSVTHGLGRLRRGVSGRGRMWPIWMAAATAAVVLVAVNPTLNALAHECGEFIARGSGLRPSRPVMPDLTLAELDGRRAALADFRGQVVLLTFWTTTCGQCQTERFWFAEFQETYRSRGLAVVGVSIDEGGPDRVRPFLEQKPVNYRMVVADREHVRPTIGASIPTTLILDRDGRIAVRHVGFCSKAEYQRDIQRVLDE